MDKQLKRGSLDVCVLASLAEDDSYGYKIIQSLEGIVEISESTLYPILRRLESGGFLTSYSVEHNGRLRKFYRMTDPGRKKIEDYLEDFKELMIVYRFIEREAKRDAE